jgi:hypothetical protein
MRFASSCGSDITTTTMSDTKEVLETRPAFNALHIADATKPAKWMQQGLQNCEVEVAKFHNDLPLCSFFTRCRMIGECFRIPHQLIEMWGTGNSKSRLGTRTLWNRFFKERSCLPATME